LSNAPRLSKSGIEYLDYSWGIWSGCRNLETGICHVKACWAKGLTTRYPKIYPDGFNPHYYLEALDSPKHLRKPSIISVGWVGDIIGYCDSKSIAAEEIVRTIKDCPQHTFLFLTKNPEKLFQWNFPDNCWVGVSATNGLMFQEAAEFLLSVEASIKYISFEPLLEWSVKNYLYSTEDLLKAANIKWVIIGSLTSRNHADLIPLHTSLGLDIEKYGNTWTLQPKIEWVKEIVEACDKAGIPVFIKENLKPLILKEDKLPIWAMQDWKKGEVFNLRQEMPTANV